MKNAKIISEIFSHMSMSLCWFHIGSYDLDLFNAELMAFIKIINNAVMYALKILNVFLGAGSVSTWFDLASALCNPL